MNMIGEETQRENTEEQKCNQNKHFTHRLDKLLQASRNGRNILNQLNNSQLDSDADGPRCDSCNQSEVYLA